MFARLVICIVNMNYLISVLKRTTLCMYSAYFMKYIVQYCISFTTLLVITPYAVIIRGSLMIAVTRLISLNTYITVAFYFDSSMFDDVLPIFSRIYQ